jgi:hypothetical protein
MLCFLSAVSEPSSKVMKENISFVSVPDSATEEEIKILISKKAKLFADYLNLNEVFLHFGKDNIIKYEFKD